MTTTHPYDLTDNKYKCLLKYTEPLIHRNLKGEIIECELQRYMYRALLKYSETIQSVLTECTCICLICEDLLNGSNVQEEMKIGGKFIETVINLLNICKIFNESETDLAKRSTSFIYKACQENAAELRKKLQKYKEKETQENIDKNTIIDVKA